MTKLNRILAAGVAGVLCGIMTTAAESQQVTVSGPTTTFRLPTQASQAGGGIDFAHAKPMPLPAARALPPSQGEAIRNALEPGAIFGQSGASEGAPGTGEQFPVQLVAPQDLSQIGGGVEPEEFGTSGQPYTTSEVNAYGDATVNYYPFRAAGKLWFLEGSSTFVCSASLIYPGIVVTAAHCVANYGRNQFYSSWQYGPAYTNGSAPYGIWTAAFATVLTAYLNGTDNCAQFGVICPDDVALITLNAQSGRYPGSTTGWFGYGWNGYSYNGSGQVLISQLGYPVALDSGVIMERNDSQGFIASSLSNNTIIGSLMTGGSSGGPWLVNLGAPPSLSGTSFGTYPFHNLVVGVTSWGYNDTTVKQQGAAPFTSGNILVLVNAVCAAAPPACS
jgi:V8-like Glu-specific endopeptidase